MKCRGKERVRKSRIEPRNVMRRSVIREDLTEEDGEDIEKWRRKKILWDVEFLM